MKSVLKFAAIAMATAFVGSTASAATILVDDFSGTLAPYVQTTVNDANTTRGVAFTNASGGLAATSTETAVEQTLFLRSDFSLGINQQLRVDATIPAGSQSQDFGVAVAATTAQIASSAADLDTRDAAGGFFFSAFRATATQFIGSGANPTPIATANALQAGNIAGQPISPQITGLFITRTAVDVFALGYSNANGDTVVGSFTVPNGNLAGIGNAIGFYTDQRGTSGIGTLDNLRIVDVPEPTSMALLGLGGLVAMRRRRTA
ncbi:MAG TPA: PEP-CTERM sorting domain-containing protein [Tepidisphaeraceae bacterium]